MQFCTQPVILNSTLMWTTHIVTQQSASIAHTGHAPKFDELSHCTRTAYTQNWGICLLISDVNMDQFCLLKQIYRSCICQMQLLNFWPSHLIYFNTNSDLFTLASNYIRIQFKILVIIFRACFSQLLALYNDIRNSRSSDQGLLVVARSHLNTKGDWIYGWNPLGVMICGHLYKAAKDPFGLNLLLLKYCTFLKTISHFYLTKYFIGKHFVTSALQRCYINTIYLLTYLQIHF